MRQLPVYLVLCDYDSAWLQDESSGMKEEVPVLVFETANRCSSPPFA